MHWPGKKLREMAIKTAIKHIHYEDDNTRYLCIGPVNKVFVERRQASTGTPFNCSLFHYFSPFEKSIKIVTYCCMIDSFLC